MLLQQEGIGKGKTASLSFLSHHNIRFQFRRRPVSLRRRCLPNHYRYSISWRPSNGKTLYQQVRQKQNSKAKFDNFEYSEQEHSRSSSSSNVDDRYDFLPFFIDVTLTNLKDGTNFFQNLRKGS